MSEDKLRALSQSLRDSTEKSDKARKNGSLFARNLVLVQISPLRGEGLELTTIGDVTGLGRSKDVWRKLWAFKNHQKEALSLKSS